MNIELNEPFVLPEIFLAELPTGAAKQAVNRLGQMIARGDFPVGTTIPREGELAEMMGISRTVVRDAIKVLSGKGMVRTARRYGTRVLPFESWNLIDPDVISWHNPTSPAATKIYRDSTQLRFIVEPAAAELAALNATYAQKDLILRAAEHISPDRFGNEAMIAADYTFHATILESSGNVMLKQMQGLILALLKFSYPTGAQASPDEKVSRRNHIAVAEAIRASKAEEARDLMCAMLKQNQLIAERIGSGDA